MMGNEQSQLSGLEIDEKAVEVSDFWSQHSASIINSEHVTNLSVLIGELFVSGSLWSTLTPLEKNSKNLMIYRHPCIIKYISSWKRSSKFYLALEEVKPLSHSLSSLNTLQICIGLHSVLKALCFLHEKASVSHNNVCVSSIYITKDGNWKLGGMEYLCRYSNLSSDYLGKTRATRYSKAVDPNEEKHFQNRRDAIDVFAFGALVYQILRTKNDDDVPALKSLVEVCKNSLQNVDVLKRPKLSSLLEHEFFNHEFISIHSFLMELPLKADEEKTAFFSNLAEKLRTFDEASVAGQLGGLLLSRMVLLNPTAQKELLPFVLCPNQDLDFDDQNIGGLFSEDVFKKYLVPKLLEIFCVRDAQIRLLLLDHFSHYIYTFTKEELQSCILPELLVGIKDTNDQLVAMTLRTLADLVPILGATTVIGGKRAKLFNDGRPTSHPVRKLHKEPHQSESVTPDVEIARVPIIEIEPPIATTSGNSRNHIMELPERPRPDGEEGETSTEEIEPSADEDLDNWEDWDINENNSSHDNTQNSLPTNISISVDNLVDVNITNSESLQNVFELPMQNELPSVTSDYRQQHKNIIPDISELDIKNQVNQNSTNDDFNFFQDMEPVIETSSKFVINKDDALNIVSSKLNLGVNEVDSNEDGWVDEEW